MSAGTSSSRRRRMWPSRSTPRASAPRGCRGAGARPAIAAHASEPLPPGAVVPSLAAPNMPDVAAVGRAVAAALGRLGGRPRRAALVIPDTVAKVSLIRFEKVPSPTGGSDRAGPLAGAQERAVPDRAGGRELHAGSAADRGRPGVHRLGGARATSSSSTRAPAPQAGVHAGLVDIATFSIINGVLADQAPPTDDWLLVHATATLHDAGRAARVACDLLPQPARTTRRDAGGRRAPDRDVLRGSPEGRGLQPRDARRRREPCRAAATRCGAASRSVCGVAVEARRSAEPAALHRSHQRRPGTARRAGAARRHPHARGKGGLTMLRTNLATRPFYNERPIRLGIAVGGHRRRGADGVQRRRR